MERDSYDSISPVDYRYWREEVANIFSLRGEIEYKLQVELALIKVLHRRGICDEGVVEEVERACSRVAAEEVEDEESFIHHDVRALVNCIQHKVSKKSKPFVHMTATSYDIVDTANAMRYRDVVWNVLIPALIKLEKVLIEITRREAGTLQIGRTHGQHAVPITFGFAMAEYVERLGQSIVSLRNLVQKLVGKFSGAVGAYNASSSFFNDPEQFEKEVLAELGLKPGDYSTQIIQPESRMRLFNEFILIGGILANLSRDMRNLQRTEIGEVGEKFEENQVGSSTMVQKRNPISFENIESKWKILVGRQVTILIDQVSEHQRDLTGSASTRTNGEIVNYLFDMIWRLTYTMENLQVDKDNLQKNFEMQGDLIIAEPLYIMLAAYGYPNAYEKVRQLTLRAQKKGRPLGEVAWDDEEIEIYLEQMPDKEEEILQNPSLYTGRASEKAKEIAELWSDWITIWKQEDKQRREARDDASSDNSGE